MLVSVTFYVGMRDAWMLCVVRVERYVGLKGQKKKEGKDRSCFLGGVC